MMAPPAPSLTARGDISNPDDGATVTPPVTQSGLPVESTRCAFRFVEASSSHTIIAPFDPSGTTATPGPVAVPIPWSPDAVVSATSPGQTGWPGAVAADADVVLP